MGYAPNREVKARGNMTEQIARKKIERYKTHIKILSCHQKTCINFAFNILLKFFQKFGGGVVVGDG